MEFSGYLRCISGGSAERREFFLLHLGGICYDCGHCNMALGYMCMSSRGHDVRERPVRMVMYCRVQFPGICYRVLLQKPLICQSFFLFGCDGAHVMTEKYYFGGRRRGHARMDGNRGPDIYQQ